MFKEYQNVFSCVQAPQDTVENVKKMLGGGNCRQQKRKRLVRLFAACAAIVVLLGAVLAGTSLADQNWMFVAVYAEGQEPELLDQALNSSAISIYTETPKFVLENPWDSYCHVYNPIKQEYEMVADSYKNNFFFQLQLILKDPNTRIVVSYGNIEIKEGENTELLAVYEPSNTETGEKYYAIWGEFCEQTDVAIRVYYKDFLLQEMKLRIKPILEEHAIRYQVELI